MAQNEPPLEEDVLLRYNRLGRERAVRGRYTGGRFSVISRLGDVQHQQQTAALLRQQLSEAMAASGALIVESGSTVTDNRFEAFQQEQAVRQFVEQARRQIKQGGIR